jgi:putative ABC transport system permease protein
MLKHYLLTIYRTCKRSPSSFSINLFGLSTALTCVLLIYLWVEDEFSMDRFDEHDGIIVQILNHEKTGNGVQTVPHTHRSLGNLLKSEFPEIKSQAVATPQSFFPAFTLHAGDRHIKATGKFAGEEYFDIFPTRFIARTPNVLTDINSIVISESLAKRVFPGIHNVVGQRLEFQLFQIHKTVQVTGVFRQPENSSEHTEFVLPFSAFASIMNFDNSPLNWMSVEPFETFVRLHVGTDIQALNTKLNQLAKSKDVNSPYTLFARPFADRYLYDRYENGVQAGGRIEYVRMFGVIAMLILILACVNFMNLSTAKALKRAKEVGVRKTFGVRRSNIILQFLGESFFMSSVAMIISVALTQLLLPQFNIFTGKTIELHLSPEFIATLVGIVLLTSCIAGIYPAVYLSRFKPIEGLKGRLENSQGSLGIRKGLVVVQFSITFIFISSLLVITNQMEFVQSRNLGYSKDNLIYLEAEGKVAADAEAFLEAVRLVPGVNNASSMLGNIVGASGGRPGTIKHNSRDITIHSSAVNYSLLETIGVTVKAGRTFSRELDADTSKCILNEAAVLALELDDPIGKKLPGSGLEIIGVVKDFHFSSLHNKVEPYVFRLEPFFATTILVNLKSGDESQVLEDLRSVYARHNPGYLFDYHFVDYEHDKLYASEMQVSKLSRCATALAVIISSLGLLGLVIYTTERRMKEISIRKILGSTDAAVFYLLSSEFLKLVLLSVGAGLPVSYLLMKNWLSGFAYRVELDWFYFLYAGVVSVVIAVLVMVSQTLRAATTNPAHWLKDE